MSSAVIQNLIYALIQVVHNFGAATVLGISTYGYRRSSKKEVVDAPLLILAIAWAVQGVSGATFGLTSLYFDGQLPDIHGIAIIALWVKIVCVVTGLSVAIISLKKSMGTVHKTPCSVWLASLALAVTALSAAAFLRWFS